MRRTAEWLDGIWRTQWTHPREAHLRLIPQAPIPSNDFSSMKEGYLESSSIPHIPNLITVSLCLPTNYALVITPFSAS